jgi:hypothetical protein
MRRHWTISGALLGLILCVAPLRADDGPYPLTDIHPGPWTRSSPSTSARPPRASSRSGASPSSLRRTSGSPTAPQRGPAGWRTSLRGASPGSPTTTSEAPRPSRTGSSTSTPTTARPASSLGRCGWSRDRALTPEDLESVSGRHSDGPKGPARSVAHGFRDRDGPASAPRDEEPEGGGYLPPDPGVS